MEWKWIEPAKNMSVMELHAKVVKRGTSPASGSVIRANAKRASSLRRRAFVESDISLFNLDLLFQAAVVSYLLYIYYVRADRWIA